MKKQFDRTLFETKYRFNHPDAPMSLQKLRTETTMEMMMQFIEFQDSNILIIHQGFQDPDNETCVVQVREKSSQELTGTFGPFIDEHDAMSWISMIQDRYSHEDTLFSIEPLITVVDGSEAHPPEPCEETTDLSTSEEMFVGTRKKYGPRFWVNQPSTHQMYHRHHGKNVIVGDKLVDGKVVVYFTDWDDPVTGMEMDISALSAGWQN